MRPHHVLLPFAMMASFAATAQDATAPTPTPRVLHPSEVALSNETQGFVYRHFPSGLRLYTSDKDSRGKSNCVRGCAAAWPPVVAPPDAEPVGRWSIIKRADGRHQWALLGRPVYVRYHDTPAMTSGLPAEPGWNVVPHTKAQEDDPFKAPAD